MEKEFLTYELALRLKELGFDEPCFGVYLIQSKELVLVGSTDKIKPKSQNFNAPTWQQAFRFFREKYLMGHHIMCPFISHQGHKAEIINEGRYELFLTDEEQLGITDKEFYSKTYNEAEIKCLNFLLRIVESKSE